MEVRCPLVTPYWLLRSPAGCRALASFEPALFTPNPTGGQPTHPLTSGGFPPQKANTYEPLAVPTGILFEPLWHTPCKARNVLESGWFFNKDQGGLQNCSQYVSPSYSPCVGG